MSSTTTRLEGAVAEHVAAVNARDTDAIMATFADDAYVNDARREFRGTGAVRRFIEQEIVADNITMDVSEVLDHHGDTIVRAAYEGDFDRTNLPDGDVILTNYFNVRDGKIVNTNLAFLATLAPPVADDVQTQSLSITVDDRAQIAPRWYTRRDQRPGSAVVHAHGGRMIAGNLDVNDWVSAVYVSATGVPFLSVDYPLAPEARGRRPAQDVYAAVAWLREHASERGVKSDRTPNTHPSSRRTEGSSGT